MELQTYDNFTNNSNYEKDEKDKSIKLAGSSWNADRIKINHLNKLKLVNLEQKLLRLVKI